MNEQDSGTQEDDKLKKVLREIVDYYEAEEKTEREEIVREFRQLDLYFRGFQDLALNAVSRDWIDLSTGSKRTSDNPLDRTYRKRKAINVQRADIESIIAALTATIPTTKFFPADAQNPLDIQAAAHHDLTAEKLKNDNSFALKFIYALYIYLNQGLVFWYTYNEKSEEYGTKSTPIYDESNPEVNSTFLCEYCEAELGDASPQVCESCGEKTEPIALEDEIPQEPQVVDYEEEPLGKTCIEFYGPLHVKTALSAIKFKKTPYLILYSDESKSEMLELHTVLGKDIEGQDGEKSNRWSRRFATSESNNNELVVKRKVWLRPWALNCKLKESEVEVKKLRQMFPKGILVTLVEDRIVSIAEEDIDKCWEASESVVAHHMHSDPHARQIKPMQDLENETVRLTTDILAHIVPERWADPEYVDFDAYSSTPNIPGALNKAKKPRQGDLSGLFHQSQPASMPKELMEFQSYLQNRRQFVSGAMPSIYGGQLKGGSGTFGEYEMSRNLSLQRLGLPWKVLLEWVPKGMMKSVKIHQDEMPPEGEFEVQQEGGGFVNKQIPKSVGKVGKAIAETSEQFPTTWPQLRGMLLELMGMGKEYIDAAITHPENIGFISKTLGFGGLFIPGKKDRDKQLTEIRMLLESAPNQVPNPNFGVPAMNEMGMPGPVDMNEFLEEPSVPVDMEMDNHPVQFTVCQVWAVSEEGIDAQMNMADGYRNVVLHAMAHKNAMMQQQMQQMGPVPPGAPGEDIGAEGSESMEIDESVGLA